LRSLPPRVLTSFPYTTLFRSVFSTFSLASRGVSHQVGAPCESRHRGTQALPAPMPCRWPQAAIGSAPVERVAIVGCGGSGKSYVARKLGPAVGPAGHAHGCRLLRRPVEPSADGAVRGCAARARRRPALGERRTLHLD